MDDACWVIHNGAMEGKTPIAEVGLRVGLRRLHAVLDPQQSDVKQRGWV